LPIMIAVLIFALLAGSALVSRLPSSTATVQATPSLPIIILATNQPALPAATAAPAAQVAAIQPALPRFVVAWAAPNGAVLGPIPEPAASAILARYGNDWVMVSWQDGQVWIRTADLGLGLADVAPQIAPAPQVVYIASEPAQAAQNSPQQAEAPQPDYQTASQEKPASEPVSAPLVEQATPTTAPIVIQAEYPTLAPMEQTDTTQEWARQQYLAEHPEVKR
jgi:hypothetical protein